MKKVYALILLIVILTACGSEPESIITTNTDKYPFLCKGLLAKGFQYTAHFAPGHFPPYLCFDSYAVNKIECSGFAFFANTQEGSIECKTKSSVLAITHVSGTVKEFK